MDRSPDGRWLVAMNGYLRYRSDLVRAIGDVPAWRSMSDPALVAAAFSRLGAGALDVLEGSFALIAVDCESRRAYAARDCAGHRALFQAETDRAYLVASDPSILLAYPCVSDVPDDGWMAMYLAGDINDLFRTAYRDIRKVPKAHCLHVSATAARCDRYWKPSPDILQLPDDAAYAEAFRARFTDAIREMSPPGERLGILLSGGTDSSALSSVATRLHRAGHLPATAIDCCSIRFQGGAADEATHCDAVADYCELDVIRVPYQDGADYDMAADIAATRYPPMLSNVSILMEPLRILKSRGVRVVFTGIGGDEWFEGSPYRCADYLLRGQLGRCLRSVRQPFVLPSPLRHSIWEYTLKPVLRRLLPDIIAERLRGRRQAPAWINPDFSDAVGYHDLTWFPPIDVPFRTWAQRQIAGQLYSGGLSTHTDTMERMVASHGMELRHPFYDKRMIEFGLSLPEEQRWRDQLDKYVVRQAMVGYLPDSSLKRVSQAEFSVTVRAVLDRMFAPGEGIVRSPMLRDMLAFIPDRAGNDSAAGRHHHAPIPASIVWNIVALDRWLTFLGR